MDIIEKILKEDRKLYLKNLREGALDNINPLQYLNDCVNNTHDQTIQKSALSGLKKHDPRKALLILAERMINSWGIGAILRSINICSGFSASGGLIILSSTLFQDDRFILEKLTKVERVMEKLGREQDMKIITNLNILKNYYAEPKIVNQYLQQLKKISYPDIKWGAIFGSQFNGNVGWHGYLLNPCKKEELIQADSYVESKIPGLKLLFLKKLGLKK